MWVILVKWPNGSLQACSKVFEDKERADNEAEYKAKVADMHGVRYLTVYVGEHSDLERSDRGYTSDGLSTV